MRNLIYLIFICCLICCSSCLREEYTIKAGNHYTKHGIKLLKAPFIKFDFVADSTWYYTTENNGWSKICGFSEGLHHNNSARLGYICTNNKLYIGSYCYVDGERKVNTIQEIYPNTIYECEIYRVMNTYEFVVDDTITIVPATKFSDAIKLENYLLFPYIGGTYTLNHNWNCKLKIYE